MRTLPPEAQQIIAFLRSIPTTGDIPQWTAGFLDALKKLLPDVDLLVARVVYSCDLIASQEDRPRLISNVRNHSLTGGAPREVIVEEFPEQAPSARMIEQYEKLKELKGLYTYTGYDYYYHNGGYIGSIVLAEMKGRSPISPLTFGLMDQLEPFFVYVFSDVIARHDTLNPLHRDLGDMVSRVVHDASLTLREYEVLLLLMYGHSYKEIAEKLHITLIAVKKRVARIHRKTGVTSQGALIARYFGPGPVTT